MAAAFVLNDALVGERVDFIVVMAACKIDRRFADY
jgi:hypothetical protein